MSHSTPRRSAGLMFGATLLLALAAQDAAAQRDTKPAPRTSPPTGTEIAAAARTATLDQANAGTATLFSKPFKFTPARPAAGVYLEAGAFLGVLENGAAGDETGLPPGKYNVYVAQVGGQWRGYAESGGQIVRQAIRVTATPGQAGAGAKPTFTEKGWCFVVYRDATYEDFVMGKWDRQVLFEFCW
ncbi:MAG: hypothetical protein L0271_05510 [Gemmatimonadetes bacterium]|nr:hypothetical protein [Gemmatimonadota bacterium]